MKKTVRLPPPLNTPEPLPHALTWPATWPPRFMALQDERGPKWRALKGRGHRQVRTRTALFAAISSVPAKSTQFFAHTPTEERRERGGGRWGWRPCHRTANQTLARGCHFAQGRTRAGDEVLPLFFLKPILYLGFIQNEPLEKKESLIYSIIIQKQAAKDKKSNVSSAPAGRGHPNLTCWTGLMPVKRSST